MHKIQFNLTLSKLNPNLNLNSLEIGLNVLERRIMSMLQTFIFSEISHHIVVNHQNDPINDKGPIGC